MSTNRNAISEAVTLYFGRDSEYWQPNAPFPERLIARFGLEEGRRLECAIKLMEMELRELNDEAVKCVDLVAVGDLAEKFLRERHPELDQQALTNFSDEFAFWWK